MGRIKRVDVAASATTRQVGVIVALGKASVPRWPGLFAEGQRGDDRLDAGADRA